MTGFKVSDVDMLRAIDAYIEVHGYSPSVRDVAKAVGYSTCPAKNAMDRLRDMGLVTFEPHVARTIRLTWLGKQRLGE